MHEYPEWTSGVAPRGVNVLWIVWAVLIPVAYLAGLTLLPRQFKQESATRGGNVGQGAESVDGESTPGVFRLEVREGSAGRA